MRINRYVLTHVLTPRLYSIFFRIFWPLSSSSIGIFVSHIYLVLMHCTLCHFINTILYSSFISPSSSLLCFIFFFLLCFIIFFFLLCFIIFFFLLYFIIFFFLCFIFFFFLCFIIFFFLCFIFIFIFFLIFMCSPYFICNIIMFLLFSSLLFSSLLFSSLLFILSFIFSTTTLTSTFRNEAVVASTSIRLRELQDQENHDIALHLKMRWQYTFIHSFIYSYYSFIHSFLLLIYSLSIILPSTLTPISPPLLIILSLTTIKDTEKHWFLL